MSFCRYFCYNNWAFIAYDDMRYFFYLKVNQNALKIVDRAPDGWGSAEKWVIRGMGKI